jgi:transposase-like protein
MATNSQEWYIENIVRVRETARSKCCDAPIEDAGECAEGCCDKWRCTDCKRTWLVEVGD